MDYQIVQHFARWLDAEDPLRRFRDEFLLPFRADERPVIYFCGHSLGPQPKAVRGLLEQELDDWARLGVEGHFEGKSPWYSYHELFRDVGARLVGALPGEVVMMNSLTVNLHLMLTSFYRPTASRYQIVIDTPVFPSDLYALQSVLRLHGINPAEGLIQLQPRPGEHCISEEAVEAMLEKRGERVALLLFSGVNFATGQWFDIPRLTMAAHRHGAIAGFDLAHAAGNVALQLHDWDVDFAVWCNYKYISAGPGAVAGCFVHAKHGQNTSLPRLAGWWGNDPVTRFDMHLQQEFTPRASTDGWQVSNPPILALAPLRASLALFDEAGMTALRAKSELLTGYLEYLLDQWIPGKIEVITPRQPERRGCALSLVFPGDGKALKSQLDSRGAICDFRPPNILRAAPIPLYNSFNEVWNFAQILAECVGLLTRNVRSTL